MTLERLLVIGIIGLFSSVAEAGRVCESAPPEYSAEKIVGTIVDAETGKPIKGAVVVASWVLTGYGQTLAGIERFKIMETVTDKKGHYGIEGWGPAKRKIDRCFWNEDPLLSIFKPGYYPKTLANSHSDDRNDFSPEKSVNPLSAKTRKSRFNGKEIKLDRFVIGQEAQHFDFLSRKYIKRVTVAKDWCSELFWVANAVDIGEQSHFDRHAPFLKTFISVLDKNLKDEREKGLDCGPGVEDLSSRKK